MMNYYQHHIGDYLTATAHLSLIEHGAYRRMLDLYYSTEKPLPLDRNAVYRLTMARAKEERAAVDSVLIEFFKEQPDGWHQARCDAEIVLCEKNRGNGKKGGRPRKNNNPDETQTEPRNNPDETQTEPNDKAPTTHYPLPIKPPLSPPSEKPEVGARRNGTRLPDDWMPDSVSFDFAKSLGITGEGLFAEIDKFRDYWVAQPGQRGRKADWVATFRNWVRKASEDSVTKRGAPKLQAMVAGRDYD